MTRIIIEALPPDKMRLPEYRHEGFGDWFFDPSNGDLHIQVGGADLMDQDEAFLVALHELIEVRLCFKAGVTQGAVDAFDVLFEKEREAGEHGPDDEPGDDPRAPYRKQHRAAMMIEHMMAIFLGRYDYGEVR